MTDLAVLFFYIDCPAKGKVGDRKCRSLRFPSFFFSLSLIVYAASILLMRD